MKYKYNLGCRVLIKESNETGLIFTLDSELYGIRLDNGRYLYCCESRIIDIVCLRDNKFGKLLD